MVSRFEKEYVSLKDKLKSSRDRSIIKHLYEFFGKETTLEKVERMVGGYEYFRRIQTTNRKQPPSPATILKELGLLRRMFTVARKQWKWKISNPVSDIELPKVRNARVRYLDAGELSRLMSVLHYYEQIWMKPLVVTALDTGLRLNNLCELMWSEVNLVNRLMLISADKMKNADSIGIPITDRLLEILTGLQKVQCLSGHVFHVGGKKLYPVKVQRHLRLVLEKAKIDNFHFHDLRHTYASYLRQSGVDLHTVSVLMGHRDLRMTKRYAHLNVDTLRAAVEKMCHNLVTLSGKEVAVSAVTI